MKPHHLAAGLAACAAMALRPVWAGTPDPTDLLPPPPPQAAAMQPAHSTAAEVLQRWGEPFRRTRFMQGHEVWHYYRPLDGTALRPRLPGTHLAVSERGRRATEHVLLFDARGVLVRHLTRELP
jgi:hypothetical protein